MAQLVKNLPANAGVMRNKGLIPGSGRSPGEGKGNPLQYSCLKISWTEESGGLQSMGVAKSQTQLSTHAHKGTECTVFFAFYIFSPFEIIVDAHAVVRNNTERSRVSFIQFHPKVAS